MQQLYTETVPGGRGPSNVTSSNPLGVGADGQPFGSSATNAAQAATHTAIDFGEDFARENSSSFYKNASFKRQPPRANTQQPSFTLKEIPLPPFEGDIRSYPAFRNCFLEIVEAQRNIEPRHKLMYLLQYLRGAPLKMAEGFGITNESYFEVIDLLEQRYGDRTVLQNALMQDIINLPSPAMKREELQLFHDKAFRTIRDLRQLGPGSGPDSILVQILLGKLPQAMRLKLMELDPATLDASTLLKGVRDHVSALARASTVGLVLQPPQQEAKTTLWSKPPGRFNQQSQHRPNGRYDARSASSSHQFHVADFAISNVASRTNKAKKQKKCLRSLSGDHGRLSCTKVSSTPQLASRQPCNLQDHISRGDVGRRHLNENRQQEDGSRNSLTRRARCFFVDRDVPHDWEQPTDSKYAVRNAKLK